jgi:hypothetical protein
MPFRNAIQNNSKEIFELYEAVTNVTFDTKDISSSWGQEVEKDAIIKMKQLRFFYMSERL